MAAADPIPDLTGLDKTAQLDALRKRMAAIPGRRDHAPTELPPPEPAALASVPAPTRPEVIESGAFVPSVRTQTLRTIPVPLPMSELLPRGALSRGTALSVTGAGSVLVGLIAAASAAGHHVAIIGQPKVGLLAVHEHGGDLSRVAVVDPGDLNTALDAASVCLDGLDLVVTTLGGQDIPPTRARALLARCRSHASVLVTVDGRMHGLDLTIKSRPSRCKWNRAGEGACPVDHHRNCRSWARNPGSYRSPHLDRRVVRRSATPVVFGSRDRFRRRRRPRTTTGGSAMTDLYENWPTTFEPPTRRIVDPPMPVLVSVALTVAGAAGGSFRDGTKLKVRAEGLAMDIKVQGTLHAWVKTTRGQWLCSLSYRVPTGNGAGFLQVDQQWCPAEAAQPLR